MVRFNLIIALLAGLAFFFIGAWLMYSEFAASGWTVYEGTVLGSSVATPHRSGGTMYRADINYSYSAGGRNYSGNCCKISSSNKGDASRMVSDHPVGSVATVLVNPQNPAESRLKDDVLPFNLIALGFVVMGGGTAALGVYRLIRG